MAAILDFKVKFLLVNYKFWKKTACKIFQTQKEGGKKQSSKNSYGTNNLALLAVCKNLEFLQHLPQNQTLCTCGMGWAYNFKVLILDHHICWTDLLNSNHNVVMTTDQNLKFNTHHRDNYQKNICISFILIVYWHISANKAIV